MGRMSDEELVHLFTGYGYEPHIVDTYVEADAHARMSEVLDNAIERIREIQRNAREGKVSGYQPFPMIIFRSPKGWSSIKELHGKRIEDNHYSHQVIADLARTDAEELEALEGWLRSYKFEELFDGKKFHPDIEGLIPEAHRRMGDNPHTMGGAPHYKPLILPDMDTFAHAGTCRAMGSEHDGASSMEALGEYVREVMTLNSAFRNVRLFSPDETYSNKLDAVFKVTKRAWLLPNKEWDKDMAHDGRVIEMLSEHSLQGLMQGYVLTGRHALFASYEAFMPIVGSMADQYAKFLHIAREVSWRGDVSSLNYILTSGSWRQEHNGFSHQNPGFIDDMLQRQGCFVNVYFPTDMNTALKCMERMLLSKNEMNLIVLEKRPVPCWRTLEEATKDVEEGISVWDFASDEDPHMVFCAVGDYLTKETLAAITVVRAEIPNMRFRFVNIVALSALGVGDTQCRVLPHDMDYYFTNEKQVVINFHGYPQTIKQMLFDYGFNTSRFVIHGYSEQGSTTTPFDMFVRNKTDRFTLAMEAFAIAEREGLITVKEKESLITKYTQKLEDHHAHAVENGTDPDDITNWVWTPRS
jgi:xylulose-5-phosphate/fructose-6-phosphate phosphoketolase